MITALAVRIQMLRDREDTGGDAGLTAVEYGLMLAVLVAIIVAAATALGGGLTAAFTAAQNALTP